MFKRRNELLKRVWKFRRGGQTSDSHFQASASESNSDQSKETDAVLYSLLKRLSDSSLKTLVESLESGGKLETGCVLFPSEEVRLGRRSVYAFKFLCKVFRWPDLATSETVKALWSCKSSNDDSTLRCCNPYHCSRVVSQDCGLPPYFMPDTPEYVSTALQGEERGVAVSSELPKAALSSWSADICTETSAQWTRPPSMTDDVWCQVAYWELLTRVGRLYEVCDNPVSIFANAPQENGLCLGLLDNNCRTKMTEHVLTHIGHGVQVTKETDGVWVYNRSDNTVFVSSATLMLASEQLNMPKVTRVPCGSSLKAFDFARLDDLRQCSKRIDATTHGPCDLFCVRVSFCKGWGENFSRRYITSCPCWLEIHLNDKALLPVP